MNDQINRSRRRIHIYRTVVLQHFDVYLPRSPASSRALSVIGLELGMWKEGSLTHIALLTNS